jgi:Arc/MetJ family transcription regulator
MIDDELITKAMECTGLKTKKAVIEQALQALIRLKSQEHVRLLRGKLHWDGDLDEMRAGRFSDVDR